MYIKTVTEVVFGYIMFSALYMCSLRMMVMDSNFVPLLIGLTFLSVYFREHIYDIIKFGTHISFIAGVLLSIYGFVISVYQVALFTIVVGVITFGAFYNNPNAIDLYHKVIAKMIPVTNYLMRMTRLILAEIVKINATLSDNIFSRFINNKIYMMYIDVCNYVVELGVNYFMNRMFRVPHSVPPEIYNDVAINDDIMSQVNLNNEVDDLDDECDEPIDRQALERSKSRHSEKKAARVNQRNPYYIRDSLNKISEVDEMMKKIFASPVANDEEMIELINKLLPDYAKQQQQ